MLYQQYISIGLYIVSPRHLSLNQYLMCPVWGPRTVSLVSNGIWYAVFVTRMGNNAVSINMWPQTALDILLPVTIVCQVALPAKTSRGVLAVLNLPLNFQCYKGSSFACETGSEFENQKFQITAS